MVSTITLASASQDLLEITVRLVRFSVVISNLKIVRSFSFTTIVFFFSKDIDECVNHTCQNGGSCLDGVNNYSCNCLPGYTGNRCETGRYFAEPGREASLLGVAKSMY